MTAEEFGAWKHDTRTKEVFTQIAKHGDIALNVIVSIAAVSTNPGDMIRVAYQSGYLKGLSEVLDMEYGDFEFREMKENVDDQIESSGE
jgi:hypothetical protein